MTDDELIEAIGDNCREKNWEIDVACCERLKALAADYGENGVIAVSLIEIIEKLLEI